jgi:hypothetical protein
MKTMRLTALILIVLVSLLALSAMAVAADGGATNITPATAAYFDNQSHSIGPNSSLWYYFYYTLTSSGARQSTTIRLLYGNDSGVDFDVWTPDEASDLTAQQPFGHGLPESVRSNGHWSAGSDLVWTGSLGATGTYYVRVTNNTPYTTTEQITIEGDGVYSAPPATPTPATSSTAGSNGKDDPSQAVLLDGTPQTIPANSVMWFSFLYLTNYIKPPFVTIRLQYGAINGLQFEVYAPERLGAWWTYPPNGHGTVETVACPTGHCATDDLTWGGAFGATGTYYVRVINNNATDTTAVLTTEWR